MGLFGSLETFKYLNVHCIIMSNGSNGWFNESERHRQAKMFGKASGGKVTAPKGVKSASGKKTKTKYYYGSEKKGSFNSNGTEYSVMSEPKLKTISTNQIKERNKASGNYFFSPSTMAFFKSRVDPTTYVKDGKAYFITSEKFEDTRGNSEARKYTIREADVNTGIIKPEDDLTKFQKYNSKAQAKKDLMKHLGISNSKKPSVVDIANKEISSKDAVAYHNKEAKRLLAKNDYAGYRYHTKEAIKINQKVMLLKMKNK